MSTTKNIQYGSGTHDFDSIIIVNNPLSITSQLEINVNTSSTGDIVVTGSDGALFDGTYTNIGTDLYNITSTSKYITRVSSIWIITTNIAPVEWTDGEYFINSLSPIGTYEPIAGSGNTGTPTASEGGSVIGSTAIHTNGDIIADGVGTFGQLKVDNTLIVDASTGGIVTLDSNGNDAVAYSFKQQGINKLTIQKDGSASLPDCVPADITANDDIVTLLKSFEVAGRYRYSNEYITASATFGDDDSGKLTIITNTGTAFEVTLESTFMSESWIDFYIKDTTNPAKDITVICGTQTVVYTDVVGAFRIMKYADNDARLLEYTNADTTNQSQGLINTVQVSNGASGFAASNATVYDEGSNTHLYLGSGTSANGVIEADGGIVALIDNNEASTSDGFYVRSRDTDTGVTVFQVIQSENTSTGGVCSAPQSSNAKIETVGAKALITKEFLDAKAINTKTIFVENPVDAEYFPIFQNLTGATITIQEISGTKSATGNMDIRLFKGTLFAYVSGTALDIQNVTLTGTSTVYRTPVSPNTVADDEWVYLYIQGGNNSTCSVNVRYTIG